MAQAFDIISRITERSGQLRLAEQKVAESILGDLSFAASASIGDLASKAGVSLASVTRFAKAMGCRDWCAGQFGRVAGAKCDRWQGQSIKSRFYRRAHP